MDKDDRERFCLIAKSSRYTKKLMQAREAIIKAIEISKKPAISFSFGKDSLVCLDIARQIKPDILVINIDRGRGGDTEEAVGMYADYAKQYGLNYHRVKTPREVLQIYREAGSIYNVQRKEIKANLIAGTKTARKTFAIDCEILGLRTEESNERQWLHKYGTLHYSESEKRYKCNPVLNWKGEEIWAYIISREVPYLSWYDHEAEQMGYEWARYSNWAGIGSYVTYGRIAHLKKNEPELFLELAKEFPEIRAFI
ncbi:MAG: phosphoadenosine phosphosulfate reductase family protein [Desulfosporosinus sp.]